jgi:hypothetical protein
MNWQEEGTSKLNYLIMPTMEHQRMIELLETHALREVSK